MKKILTILLISILTSCTYYDNPNAYIGSMVLDTVPIFSHGDKESVWYYMYKVNFVGEDGTTVYLKTLKLKPENHYFAPGDTISFDKPFIKTKAKLKPKVNNIFVE